MKKRAIVYTIDNDPDCFLQMVQSIKSVVAFAKDAYDIYILSNCPKPWMHNIYQAKVIDVNKLVAEYNLSTTDITWRKHPVSPMLLFRLLIPLVPELQEYEKVLYLDTDTEVWNEQFFDIFDKNNDSEVICVKDSLTARGTVVRISHLLRSAGKDFKEDPSRFNRWNGLIKGSLLYVNSGVIVFNMPVIKTGYADKVRFVYSMMNKLGVKYPEQDVLNVYYNIHVIEDRRYNGWDRYAKSAFLRHYVGNERKKHAEYPFFSTERPNTKIDGAVINTGLGVFAGIVDKVYLLVNYEKLSNFETIKTWFDKNGVTDIHKIQTSYTGNYDKLIGSIPSDNINPKHMDNLIGHYKAIEDALRSGYGKIAIFEDTFMPTGFEDALLNLNPSFDIALCQGGSRFKYVTEFEAASSKGYLLNIRGMAALKRLFESLWDPTTDSRRLRYVHRWFTDKILPRLRTYTR